jgi:hypothetical protein
VRGCLFFGQTTTGSFRIKIERSFDIFALEALALKNLSLSTHIAKSASSGSSTTLNAEFSKRLEKFKLLPGDSSESAFTPPTNILYISPAKLMWMVLGK